MSELGVLRVEDIKGFSIRSALEITARAGMCLGLGLGTGLAGTVAESTVFASPASASSLSEYPWPNARDYSPVEFEWWVDENGDGKQFISDIVNDERMDPNGYYYRNCTSYVAWRLSTYGINASGLGNGGEWDTKALNKHFTVDDIPEQGDAAVWDGVGHVAFVEAVHRQADGTYNVDISEYNYGDPQHPGRSNFRSGVKADHYVDFNGTGKSLDGATVVNDPGVLAAEVPGPNDPRGDMGFQRVPGGVLVSGWAIDPETWIDRRAIGVKIRYGATGGGSDPEVAVTANVVRPDLDVAINPATGRTWSSDYGNAHGFQAFVPMLGGDKKHFCATGINVTQWPGKDTRFSCKDFYANSDPIGSLDAVKRIPGGIRAVGWTLDPDTAESTKAEVFAGNGTADWVNNPANWSPATLARPDVAAAFPNYGSAHGYSVDITVPADKYGPQTVCTYLENKPGTPGNGQKVCRTINVNGDAFGALDVLWTIGGGNIQVGGWAIDPDTNPAIPVDVYGGDGTADPTRNPSWGLTANQTRDDVGQANEGYGPNHGYGAIIHAGTGTQTFCLYATNSPGTPGHGNKIDCKTVNVT